MPKLTKRDIVRKVSDKLGLTHFQAYRCVQLTIDCIVEALVRGDVVELRNFGVFEPRLTKPRVGRNPKRPDADVPIPERAVVKFKAGKSLRERTLLLTSRLAQIDGASQSAEPSDNSNSGNFLQASSSNFQ
jgi:nucleoid DNA-binding protein